MTTEHPNFLYRTLSSHNDLEKRRNFDWKTFLSKCHFIQFYSGAIDKELFSDLKPKCKVFLNKGQVWPRSKWLSGSGPSTKGMKKISLSINFFVVLGH